MGGKSRLRKESRVAKCFEEHGSIKAKKQTCLAKSLVEWKGKTAICRIKCDPSNGSRPIYTYRLGIIVPKPGSVIHNIM